MMKVLNAGVITDLRSTLSTATSILVFSILCTMVPQSANASSCFYQSPLGAIQHFRFEGAVAIVGSGEARADLPLPELPWEDEAVWDRKAHRLLLPPEQTRLTHSYRFSGWLAENGERIGVKDLAVEIETFCTASSAGCYGLSKMVGGVVVMKVKDGIYEIENHLCRSYYDRYFKVTSAQLEALINCADKPRSAQRCDAEHWDIFCKDERWSWDWNCRLNRESAR